ncbi:CaiB/BaiF CoA transferase family protein [Paraburkholderia unamae]|uniref:Alpha-methylacyl-CoA racemase n=1 Tax=Paraburkholderia unamae TaxID=219649 RepID=A0ABX5KIB0_9BURK|nr:CaiB/BaiF CoA-transferase family protein [Paraburkholderia unamae]PVX81167.1 alpha-methylacyl-CoA racemase [Paraburkholderia unamae]
MERAHPSAPGPLQGFRIVEFAGIGPAPFAGMLLADLGADVVMIDRLADARAGYPRMALNRGKRSIALDLKSEAGRALAWEMLASADALIEGFRPGVMERLGFGPDEVAKRHRKLVYGRMTGWGQSGPLAQSAGHDINYVALTGALSLAARPGASPSIPPTFIGDMGGGAMFLVTGVLAALLEAQRSGRGQVVDAAIVDGTALLGALIHSMRGIGAWVDRPERNFFSHTSPFYDVFECADGKHVTLGAIEPQFYAQLLQRLGLDDVDPAAQYDSRAWPELKARVAALIRTREREHWCGLLLGTDVCFAPVLDLDEAAAHEHNRARGVFVEVDGKRQPAPAPRFSRTPSRAPQAGPLVGEHTEAVLMELGHAKEDIAASRAQGACA